MTKVTATNVHETLKKYLLVDGFDLVLDLRKSQGTWIYDAKSNKKYLDFFTCFASSPIGFNHPKLTTPEFMKKLGEIAINKPANSDLYTVEMAEFVETLGRVAMPEYMKYMFFISGGGLAVENALKTAMDYKIRTNFNKGMKEEKGHKIIHFKDAFHGRTGYTLSLTNTADPRKTKYFAKFDWPRINNPVVRFPLTQANLDDVIKRENTALEQMNQAFESNKDDIAGLIIEPIQAEGGDHHFRKEFMQSLRKVTAENDALLIFDEVQTGVGLTGKMWAHQHFDVKADIFSFGKKTQVCGIMVSEKVDRIENNVFNESSRLNSTWGGNLIDMVRAQRYFEIIEEENLVDNAAKMGVLLLKGLNAISEANPEKVFNVRGLGLMCAFDLPSSETRDKFLKELMNRGMILLSCGHISVRFRPPLNVSEEEVNLGLELISDAVKAC